MPISKYTVEAKNWSTTLDDLALCFQRWGVSEWSVEPAMLHSGAQKAHWEDPEKCRAIVYWKNHDGIPTQMSIATFHTYSENFRAAYLNVDSMRMIERRGGHEAMANAYMRLGTGSPQERDPYEILGLRPDAPPASVEAVYKQLARERHPDAGGTTEAMEELNRAYDRIKEMA